MIQRNKKLSILLALLVIALLWRVGDQKTGLFAINRKMKDQAAAYLEQNYSGMHYRITDVGFSSPSMAIASIHIQAKTHTDMKIQKFN